MTIIKKKKIVRAFYNNTNPTDEDRFLYTEAERYLIEEAKDPVAMAGLGA